jgi:MFS family permease
VSVAEQQQQGQSLFRGELRAMTFGLVLVITLVAFEALAVATVLPAIEEELGGLRIYGWAFSGFLLASLVGITWAGGECDARGVVRPFVLGLTLFGIGLVVAGAAPAMWVVVVGRCIQGLGAGAVPAVVYVVIARAYENSMRPRLFALMSSAWVIPGLAGPAIAGAVAEYAHWRLVFAGLLPLLVIASVLTLPALRRVPHAAEVVPARGDRQTARSVQLAAGAALILGGLTSGEWWLAASGLLAGGLIAVPALRLLLPAGTLVSARGMPAGIMGMGLLNMGFFGAEAFVPFIVTDVREQSTLVAGAVLASVTMTWTSGSWLLERLSGRVERRSFVAVGVALVVVGVGSMTVILSESVPVWWAMVAWGISGLGMGMAYTSYSLIVLAGAAPGEEGVASASLKLNEVLGAALGAGGVGALVAVGDAGGWRVEALGTGFVLMCVVLLVGLSMAVRLGTNAEHGVVQ